MNRSRESLSDSIDVALRGMHVTLTAADISKAKRVAPVDLWETLGLAGYQGADRFNHGRADDRVRPAWREPIEATA